MFYKKYKTKTIFWVGSWFLLQINSDFSFHGIILGKRFFSKMDRIRYENYLKIPER